TASGYLSIMVLVGSAGGLAANVASSLLHVTRAAYAVIAVALVAAMLPTLAASRGEGLVAIAPPPPRPLGERVREFVRPMLGGDFAWVILTRTMITAGIAAVSPFTFFFFRDVVRVGNPDVFNPIWLLVVLVFAAPLGFVGGRVSDRHGRKPFVYASGGIQAGVALVFIILYPTAVPLVLLLGAVYG